jgi:hypothetical protein
MTFRNAKPVSEIAGSMTSGTPDGRVRYDRVNGPQFLPNCQTTTASTLLPTHLKLRSWQGCSLRGELSLPPSVASNFRWTTTPPAVAGNSQGTDRVCPTGSASLELKSRVCRFHSIHRVCGTEVNAASERDHPLDTHWRRPPGRSRPARNAAPA